MKIYGLGDDIPWKEITCRQLTPEEYQEAMTLAREAFAKDRLDEQTNLADAVPVEQVLAEIEERL